MAMLDSREPDYAALDKALNAITTEMPTITADEARLLATRLFASIWHCLVVDLGRTPDAANEVIKDACAHAAVDAMLIGPRLRRATLN